jgi:hypothetical protein
VMPATSNRMATERKIQGIQLKATGILEGRATHSAIGACPTQQRNCMTP